MSLRYLPGGQSLTCAQRLIVHKVLSCLSTWFPQKQTLRQDWTAGSLFRKWFPRSTDRREKWDRKGENQCNLHFGADYSHEKLRFDALGISRRQCRTHFRVVSPKGQGTAICHLLSTPPGAVTPPAFLDCSIHAERLSSDRQPWVLAEGHAWHVLRGGCKGGAVRNQLYLLHHPLFHSLLHDLLQGDITISNLWMRKLRLSGVNNSSHSINESRELCLFFSLFIPSL